MNPKIFIILLSIILFCFSCAKKESQTSIIKEKSLDLQVYEAYSEGKRSLEEGDVLYAAKKFNEAELLFPQSRWASKSALMAAYSYYIQDYYGDAISELNRFVKIYPNDPNLDYANYLLGICYYEQIVDEKKDTQSILQAQEVFNFIIKNYPNSDYALDADYKLELIDDILASKEMYIGRYYLEKKKWIPAINRFKTILDKYDTTIYAEEAIHRLVETYYILGLKDEARKYAKLLGYNYQSSKWYEKTYIIFNKNYEKINKNNNLENKNKNKKSIINKIKSLID